MKYYGLFGCKKDIEREFACEFDGDVIYAHYDHEDWGCDGHALVIYRKGKSVWMVEGSHCSCYGLSEDGWNPERLTKKMVKHLLAKGYGYWTDRVVQRKLRRAFEIE